MTPIIKPGRPRDVDRKLTLSAMKPWKKQGISRAQWYRNNKAEKKGKSSGK